VKVSELTAFKNKGNLNFCNYNYIGNYTAFNFISLSSCWWKRWNKNEISFVEHIIWRELIYWIQTVSEAVMKMISFRCRIHRVSYQVYSRCDYALWEITEMNMQMLECSLWILISSPLFEGCRRGDRMVVWFRMEFFIATPHDSCYSNPEFSCISW
jgi:hypothetical protein